MRPKLLDLFCGAGGAAMGYHLAGFDVVGVDVNPQPRYPFEFVRGDALGFLATRGHEFDVIHASPPCHDHTALKSRAGHDGTGWLLPATRTALSQLDRPWVIENVPGSNLRVDLVLCGAMFGLRTYRHRHFEISGFSAIRPTHPRHAVRTAPQRGRRAAWNAGYHITITGDVGTYCGPEGMGIDWMTGAELSQAIPPAYTRFIGEQLIERLAVSRHHV